MTNRRISPVYQNGFLLVALIGLLAAALACSSGSPTLQPDETEMTRHVEQTLAAQKSLDDPPTRPVNLGLSSSPAPTNPPVGTPTPTPSPSFGKVDIASQIDNDKRPIDPGYIFQTGVTDIYATFQYTGMRSGLKVKFHWMHDGSEWYTSEIDWGSKKSGNYARHIYYEDGRPLESGDWAIEIYIDGVLVQTALWKIE